MRAARAGQISFGKAPRSLTGELTFAINASGQVVGSSYTSGFSAIHAFRTAPNKPHESGHG
jgi:probable HAF family extracellular repeat protein